VGIGEVCQREPVEMVEGLVQEQFGETYKLEKEDFFGWVLWDLYKGSWRKFYSFTEEPQLEVDFIAPNFFCEKHPDSPFNKDEMFAVKTLTGRKTLDGHIYKEFSEGQVTVRELTEAELPEAYARFGLK
jgi:N-hydroxyarylamine O-acetyltransferase